jgi:hypothetical protein
MKKGLVFYFLLVHSMIAHSQDFGFNPIELTKLVQEMEIMLNRNSSDFNNADIIKYEYILEQFGNIEGTQLVLREGQGGQNWAIIPFRNIKNRSGSIYTNFLNEIETTGHNLSYDERISFHPRFLEIISGTLGALSYWILTQFVYNEFYKSYWQEQPPVPEQMRFLIQWSIEYENPENTTEEFSEQFFGFFAGWPMAVWCGYNKRNYIFSLDHRDGY